jgi:hypothetical protein
MLVWRLFAAALWQRGRARGICQPLGAWALYGLAGTAAIVLYFHDYQSLAAHPSMQLALGRPLQTSDTALSCRLG